jgi:hypothetical protein
VTSHSTSRRVRGRATSNVGNAIAQDHAHDTSQVGSRFGARPSTRNVLIRETIHVMKAESSSGSKTPAYRRGTMDRGCTRDITSWQAVEEIDDTRFQRIFSAHDEEAIRGDEALEDL